MKEKPMDYSCKRCGAEMSPAAVAKAFSRGRLVTTCVSCRAKRAVQVGSCRPYQGDFDLDTFQPMKNGQPYKPGKRLCGKADCVADRHIEQPFDFAATYAEVMAFQFGPKQLAIK